MTKKERVLRAIEFRGPDHVPFASGVPGLSDIFFKMPLPARDWQPDEGFYPNVHPAIYYLGDWRWKKPMPLDVQSKGYERQDEFGCVWKSVLKNSIGEVVGHPLKSWDDLESFKLPDPNAGGRFERFNLYQRLFAGDSFVMGHLENGIWERSHFIRGYAELLMDTVAAPDRVGRLADRLLDEWFIPLIEIYARQGVNGIMMTDDWGMQKGLMIRPRTWREIFKPRYARLFDAAHRRGMKFFLHSCGDIQEIIPDFIEAGLDALQKDDIEFMGVEALAELFSGKICFMGSLDIQRTMPGASDAKIFEETHKMLRLLASKDGGFIGMYYTQPEAAGVTWRQMLVMHAAFIKYGKYPIT